MTQRARTICRAALIGLATLTAAPAAAEPPSGERFDLQVVGVYRPVDLTGRTVQAPREIWLRATDAAGDLSTLIGRTLTVHRTVEVPAQVPVGGAPASQPADAPRVEGDAVRPAPKAKKRRVKRRPPSRAVARERAEAEGRAPAGEAEVEPTAKADAPAPAVPVEHPADAPPLPLRAPAPRVRPPSPPSVPTTQVEVQVGRVEVVEVRGQVAVARVVEDGIDGGAPAAPPVVRAVMGGPSTFVDLPAVAAGDTARLVVTPPPASPPPPMSAEEKQALADEKKAMESELRRRNSKRKPYERKVMKWKL
ncbi:MAG: hypothetical protein H6704_30715 [Myxococcales bacterium]|nr:hypothetical protein [Myxococcales bacterium]